MSSIRGTDTKPEMVVRQMLHRMGYRYRLHVKNLPGKPDLVLPRLGKIILIHGCCWHTHTCRYGQVTPKTNAEFWESKRRSNAERDRRTLRFLRKDGWRVFIVWECQIMHVERLARKMRAFLG